jgi:hypothetical protein
MHLWRDAFHSPPFENREGWGNPGINSTGKDGPAPGADKFIKPQKNWIAPTNPADVLKYVQQLQIYNHNSWNTGLQLSF